MTEAKFDAVGIGNAIVDVLCYEKDGFLEDNGLVKGTMALIDEARAEKLYGRMGPSTECSGGSVANSMAGLASLGARAAFIGKVRDDQLGNIFRHDMQSTGVTFDTSASTDGKATARSLIFVTPDGQRTMNTYLGACGQVSAADINETLIRDSAVTFLEGYLWDHESAREALVKACEIAHEAGRKTAFTLSDPFCVERHRGDFSDLINDHIDILFANEKEIKALYQNDELDEAAAFIRSKCEVTVLTRSAEGAEIITPEETIHVDAVYVDEVRDSTGAGDLYASGFLYGFIHNFGLENAAMLGNRCAAHIITQLGARPMKPLSDFLG